MHKSKLAGFIIDCNTDDLDAAAAFWGGALGMDVKTLQGDEEGKYIRLVDPSDRLHVEVQSVEPNSPAAKTGLLDGDLLVRFADKPIEGVDDLHKALRAHAAGTTVRIGIIRRGARIDLHITPQLAR